MRKRFFQRNFFLKCLMVLLAIGWSTNSAWAATTYYWKLQVEAIHRDGSEAASLVAVGGSSSLTPTGPTFEMTSPSTSITYKNSYTSYPDRAKVFVKAEEKECEIFQGWYLDRACTQRLSATKSGQFSDPCNNDQRLIPIYEKEADANNSIQTIYALFSESACWAAQGDTPPTIGEYYIFNTGKVGFIGPKGKSGTNMELQYTADARQALVFTLSAGSDDTKKKISTIIDDVTWYLKPTASQWDTDTTREQIIDTIHKDNNVYCRVKMSSNNKYWGMNSSGGFTAQASISTTYFFDWVFISRQAFLNNCKVKSKNSDGSVLIDSPTGSGTAYVSFKVSEIGNDSDFVYSLSNTAHWEMVDTTRSGNVITLGVKYKAQGTGDVSTTTVTMSNKANPTSEAFTSKTATATAFVSFTPVCEMAVGSKLDWSYDDETLVETFNAGMEVAASQRMRTKDKLVYNGNNAIVRDIATWTATIAGTNANQFKFKNGTQTYSGLYSADSLDVIYAPTAAGTHTATLSVVVSYTDPNGTVTSDPVEVTLTGKAQNNASMVTMAVNGATASNNASLNIGDIIGTNSEEVTVNLYIQGMSNLTKEWSAPAGAFEFDENTIDFSKANQTLTFRAHRTTAAATATNHTGTLTIKSGETTVGTLTLQYTAKPLLTPEVTWNWALLNEDATYSNPLTTNSDGAWTLEQKDGNGGMTYNAADTTITTEYMHHETGYKAKFELNIEQTDSFAAYRDTTLETTIVEYIPAAIEINSEDKFLEYVEVVGIVGDNTEWLPENNAMNVKSSKVWFKWSGQSTFAFDFEAPIETSAWKIYEMYEDGTEQTTYDGPFYNGQHHEFAVSPNTYKLRLEGNNKLKNVRYFEYDTIDVDYPGITFLEGGDNYFDITATYANKREVTVSLSAGAQPYFELRAEGKPTGSSLVYNDADGLGVHKMAKDKVFTVAIKAGVDFAEAKAAAKNGFQVTLQDNYTFNSEIVVLPISMEDSYIVTYKGDANGSYKVAYHNDMEHPHTVSGSDYPHTVSTIVELYCTATLSEPIPASGYMFRGWKLNGELVSCKANYTLIPGNGAVVEPIFVVAEEAVYGIDAARFADLDEALSTAGSIADTKPVVTLLKDVTLEAATHTIPAGVTLLIPYKADYNALQTTPEITTTDEVLSAYRTLTLKEGANIVCNGTICVSGKIKATGGGFKSAYTTGECGVINMATGGHIELNNGAQLYCWGYIKGQDMDQGNNTQGTGTVIVNSGAIVHENFELGDWRGGTASSNIYYEKDTKHLFPFQSYALQNVEVPTTYKFGSKLETFMAVNTGFGSIPFAVSMIGSQNTLFLLQDEGSVIRKWYDPTTDLTCYELSGTAQLDQLVMNLPFVGNFESGDCNLPISNSMHIILKDDLTLSKRLMQQAGSIIEIKSTATINLENELYMYDKDEWGLYIHNYYFRSFNNLTSHKDRGAENSKAGLEDAKFIVDGVLNVQNGGKLYATAGGANIMGNGGGEIHFTQALPAATQLWAVTVKSGKPYIEWESNDVAAANLCNEDGSYTKSLGFATFYNIHGRWFETEDAVESADHTYWFRYLSNGNTGEEVGTNAVYSHDKTGLEARMKWFNVVRTADNCTDVEDDLENPFTSNWWIGSNPAAYYNYTMLGEWHQFMPAEGEGIYSGSNNVLYHKDECTVTEEGYIDENCLYTIGGVKKALVNGVFIPLTSNGYDPAYYHEENEVKTYYICFSGCNWHEATPYVGESKAYTIHPETGVSLHYIWFNNDWLNVLRDGSFFYTEDEQTNVRTYYAYVNGEWEVATPYVSVSDAAETRTFYMIKEAFNVASIKKDATITLLRDIPNVSERLSYETQNTTCTLDLNGHLLAGEIDSLIYVNAPGATFIITDNTTLKLGKIRTTKTRAIFVKAGTVEVNNGTIEATVASGAAYAIYGAAAATININGGYFLAQGNSSSKCVHAAGTYAITGGYYNINTGLANYTVDAYPFANDDPVYKWVVEAAWTIIFKNGETTLQTLHVKQGEMPVYTAAFPTLDNHQFTGWNPAVAAATANVTYQAQFAELEGEEKCVTFNANGGNATLPSKYVAEGDPVGDLPTATKEGHTFDGWFTEASAGTQVTSSTTVSTNVTYYAHYTKNSYTLTWDANGATITSADNAYTHGSVEYGTAIIVPSVSKDGWTFDGWNVTPASTMPAANTTYTAQWTIPYTVQHKQQNLNDAGYTVFETDNFTAKSGEYITPAVKTYDGFITPETQTVQIGAVTEVTYNYARRSYTITLDANGGTCATTSLTVKHGATLTLPVATKNGANCTGWFTKAIGGDQVTNETEILYNIGTLYAQYADLNVTAPLTVSDERNVSDLRITTTGELTITGSGSVTANNFILESNGSTASGQFVAGYEKLTYTHAYFDLKLNAKNHQWYAVAVPWQVNAETGISVNGKTLELGKDFDIIYYDGARRATDGKQKCWSYVEDDGEKTLVPGRLYMIGLMSDAQTVRFEKKALTVLSTTTTSVAAHASTTGDETDKGWNGVANPALFHAFVNPGVTEGQVYVPDEKRYETVTLNETKFVVGEGAFVQVSTGKAITVTKDGAFAAPRRARTQAVKVDVRIAPAEADYTDRLFIKTTDSKEADTYTVGEDLAKVGVSSIVPQMWINRYDAKLCVNTAELTNETAEYPLGISVPANGEYTISIQDAEVSDQYSVYLTLNNEAIWNLSDAPYTLDLTKGTTNAYGLRISAKAPQVVTGVDEAVVDAKGETKKVLINNQVFIIRGNEVYTIDGQLVK